MKTPRPPEARASGPDVEISAEREGDADRRYADNEPEAEDR